MLTTSTGLLTPLTGSANGSVTANAGAFDNAIDFGGTSGGIQNGIDGGGVASLSTIDATELPAFTGPGGFSLAFAAVGASNVSGSGNLIGQINTRAGATATVTYEFDVVPIPAAGVLAATALAGLVGIARRRRACRRGALRPAGASGAGQPPRTPFDRPLQPGGVAQTPPGCPLLPDATGPTPPAFTHQQGLR